MYDSLFTRGGLSLERLWTFCRIVQGGGITAGAGQDAVRQSQFSRQLRELERFFGVELLERGRGGVRLTGSGRELLRLASAFLGGLEEFQSRCARRAVRVTVGAGESVIHWWLLPRLPRAGAAVDDVTISFENRRNSQIVDGLLDGSLDLGVLSREIREPRLGSVPLARFRYRLFVPDALARGVDERGGAFPFGVPLALLLGAGHVRQALEQEARRVRTEPRTMLRLSSYPQLAAAVASGHAAAILPEFAAPFLGSAPVRVLDPGFLGGLVDQLQLVWNPALAEVRPTLGKVREPLCVAWASGPVTEQPPAGSGRRTRGTVRRAGRR